MSQSSKSHKPVVVVNGEGHSYCRLCGLSVKQRSSRNGRHVTSHDESSSVRYPVLDDSLRPVS